MLGRIGECLADESVLRFALETRPRNPRLIKTLDPVSHPGTVDRAIHEHSDPIDQKSYANSFDAIHA